MSLTRKAPFRRGAAPARRTRLKARNAKRREAEFARCYGSTERVEWVKRQLCYVCGALPSENAHIVTGGMGRKSDFTNIVPLCVAHHALLHRMGRPAFERYLTTDLDALAGITEARWQSPPGIPVPRHPLTP